ncbi:hypothetical protein J2X46_002513 [Nocardioides sp. BE266]|uniref:SdrD B-like domain-containing protein n=1 Tax=Nocardioides sp. BE266 TaxID=2817725 RepID=UPI0028677BCA|nr:SdrD B-like domain-containing protein [Nocardioides sp. BE266]MDR7253523.1 hypothetical protein [Nocardioides sp. BE266]
MRGQRTTSTDTGRRFHTAVGRRTLAVLASVTLGAAGLTVLPAVTADAAPTNVLVLAVTSARTEPRALGGAGVQKGDAVDQFTFIVNRDTTGDTNQKSPTGPCSTAADDYPTSCGWTSLNAAPDQAPIVAQGDETTLAGGLTLPDGNYLVSVLADGFKLDGAHFTMPLPDTVPVPVQVQPMPLPDSTVRGQVFEDMAPTNGAYDAGDRPLAGFVGHLNDVLGEVSTDVYGNPLCTTYVDEDPVTHEIPLASLDQDMLPVVDKIGGECVSDADGVVTYPHMGTNRYTQYVTPRPAQAGDPSQWVQTTTLEGNHDWDTWVMEGSTGYDTEFVLAGEAVPAPLFGFAVPTRDGQPLNPQANGHITGRVMRTLHYVPPKGGIFDLYNGYTGSKVQRPITDAWLSLSDLGNGDQAVWVGRAGEDGRFDISGVPDGDYTLTWWDEAQNNLLALQAVTVSNGGTVEMGTVPMTGWWTEYSGFVFNDANRNGVRNAGENGVPNFTLTLRKRDNSLMDRGMTTVTTDANGYYSLDGAYPLGEFGWTVLEAYSDSFYTTGVTYQADNQAQPTTVKGAGVDVSTLNIIGLGGTIDFGVHAYGPPNGTVDPSNGGIVGSITYDTTRNELDPRYAAAEDWQPGVPDIPVMLYDTVDCGTHPGVPCDADENHELDPDGSYRRGALLNSYLSETWEKPRGCTARDLDGVALVHGVDEDVLARNQETDGICIPAFSQSVQFGTYPTDQGTPDANFGAAVNGNYGFGDGCFNGTLDATDPSAPECVGGQFTSLKARDYLVAVEIPDDETGSPMYKVTSEEDINIGNGNDIVPQIPPPACAGPLHTVDVAGIDAQGDLAELPDGSPNPAFGGDGPDAVRNQTFVDLGGSPYEGTQRPRCGTKLVTVSNGKSVVPMFNVFTDVPVPSRLRGLIIDDVNFSADIKSTAYGEKLGAAFVPVGIYDFDNQLVTTVQSDYNGFWDVLLPSSNHISCPTPSGVCGGMYRFVGNDPGVPGSLNPDFNPRYRTIATEFEALPGVTIPTDLAVTQVGTTIGRPGTGQLVPVTCPQGGGTPQLFAVSRPYVNGSGAVHIEGTGFGAAQGTGSVTLDGVALPTTNWSSTAIDVTVPPGTPTGAHTLRITGNNGQHTANGLTFHVLGQGYNPAVREVGPGRTYATIQAALDAGFTNSGNDLVVVYPGTPSTNNPRLNPRGAYYENLIMASPVKLQGVGPGGFQGTTFVPGSIIDGSSFAGDTQLATDWYTKLGAMTWDGNQDVNDGQVIYLLASQNATNAAGRARQFTSAFPAAIDGFDIRGGDQQGFPGNINNQTGAPTGLPANITTQGGAVFANAYVRNLQITNNVVENNGGAYGTIRLGTPDLPAPDTNQHNENVRITDNRIVNNAGTNLAGGIGLFAGSDAYQVSRNDICGNFSLEYGAGVSVYGRSPNGRIDHNRITFNHANDEGGAIMMAGQLPADPNALSPGTGAVDIYANQIQANLSNDDGGGIRFLMAGGSGGTDAMNVYNNTIVNNVSTHEGGGIALDDAPNVRIYNNTIMKNLTTATAVTSDGSPAPAGLSTTSNSQQLQSTLPNGSPTFSKPLLFNNIFWDNRAGTRAGNTVTGIGVAGDASAIEHWDLGVSDGTGELAPTSSIVQQAQGMHPYTPSATNSNDDPAVQAPYDLSVSFAAWRQNPAFVDATLVAVEAPADQLGDYHLTGCPASPACNRGTASAAVPAYQAPPASLSAPGTDIDDDSRPAGGGFDAGSDEVGGGTVPPAMELFYSTAGSVNPTGVNGTADDADVYRWNGTLTTRHWDASAVGVPAGANLDGYSRVDDTHFYASFTGTVSLPGLGQVGDEDVVYYSAGSWQLWFDGSARGLTAAGVDLGATSVVGSTLYLTTQNTAVPPGAGGTGDDADVYRWDGGSSYTRVIDATAAPYNLPNSGAAGSATNPQVDGLVYVDPTHVHLSFSNDNASVPGLPANGVQDEDVVSFSTNAWSVSFDGTTHGLSGNAGLDIDAISQASGASAPPPPTPAGPLSFSTVGNANPPGVGGTADDSDIYRWNGTAFTRTVDASASPYGLPLGADVDGFSRVNATHFYLSFSTGTTIARPGPDLTVRDDDVVYYNAGTWQLWFDGSAHGLPATTDVGDISVESGTLYFSTTNATPPGAGGTGDNADVYRWNSGGAGNTYTRVFNASAAGLPASANVDGVDVTDATHLDLSFSTATVTVPGLGTVQDEDVVHYAAGAWSVYFDGTARGLDASADLDIDAIDLP